MITTTLSTKNQITFPKFILEMLQIQSGDKLLVQAEANQIVVRPMGESIIDSLAGSIAIPESKKGVSFARVLSSTKKIVAKKLATQ